MPQPCQLRRGNGRSPAQSAGVKGPAAAPATDGALVAARVGRSVDEGLPSRRERGARVKGRRERDEGPTLGGTTGLLIKGDEGEASGGSAGRAIGTEKEARGRAAEQRGPGELVEEKEAAWPEAGGPVPARRERARVRGAS